MKNTVKDQSIRAGVSERFMLEIMEHSGADPWEVADACGRFSNPERRLAVLRDSMRGLDQAKIVYRCDDLMGDNGIFIARWIVGSR